MLHACNAVDGTAKKESPGDTRNKSRFTRLLRQNYDILGPMGIPGIDLTSTRFPVRVNRRRASDPFPDAADLIYEIHRCTEGHGDELPNGFELSLDSGRLDQVPTMTVVNGAVQLSDRAIFGLIAVAVLQSANSDQKAEDGYVLTFNGDRSFDINEWWGRKAEFLNAISDVELPSVTLAFGDWMDTREI